MENRNFWCYRINKDCIDFFWKELEQGRLRQGWGWLQGQDLRKLKRDEGAARNKPMFDYVKEGDILLVPRLPDWEHVAIVEATEDWDSGYKYEIDEELGDYGHIFPAKYIKCFVRDNKNVTGNIRATLKNRLRFWNINHFGDDVKKLLETDSTELEEGIDYESRLEKTIEIVFNEKEFSNKLYDKLVEQFTRDEWEHALVHGLGQLFPSYIVERVGGTAEKKHGTDILIRIPGIIPDTEYCIAIQVKDYEGFVSSDVINQINKADKFWNNETMKLIEKIVVVTKAEKDENIKLANNRSGVKIIFSEDLKQLLTKIGKTFVGTKL